MLRLRHYRNMFAASAPVSVFELRETPKSKPGPNSFSRATEVYLRFVDVVSARPLHGDSGAPETRRERAAREVQRLAALTEAKLGVKPRLAG
jgi:hypothetical protein